MLIPKSIKLINCGKHADASITYVPGITGVTGPNGTGKSMISHIAPLYALTGMLPENYKKDDLLKWGTTKGYIEYIFEANGKTYTVTRNTHNSGAKIEWDKEVLVGAKKVNVKLEQLIGIPLNIFSEICFIPQGKVTNIIDMKHSERIKLFQKLTGTLKAEDIRELLQHKINDIDIYAVVPEDLDKMAEDLENISKQIQHKQKALKGYANIVEHTAEQYKEAELRVQLPVKEEIDKKIESLQLSLDKLEVERDYVLKKYDIADKVSEHIITNKEHKQAIDYKQYSSFFTKKVKLEKQLASIETNVSIPESAEEQLNNVTEELNEIEKKIAELNKQLQMAELGKCPICESPYEGEDKDVLRSKIIELGQDCASLTKTRADLRHAENIRIKALEKYNTQKAVLKENIKTYETEMSKFNIDSIKTFDPDTFKVRLEKAKQYQEYSEKKSKAYKELTELEEGIKEHKLARASLGRLTTITREQKKAAEVCRETYYNSMSREKVIKSELELLNESFQEKLTQQEVLKKRLITNKINKHIKKLLEEARDELHREKLPKMVMEIIREKLNKLIEIHLEKFNVPFVAYLNEDFDPYFDTVEKTKVPARIASGGERAALALSSILAIAEMFGTTMLAMDEPTYGFDKNRMKDLVEVFLVLKSYAEKSSYITIVTHVEELKPTFSHTVETTLD
jgi:DNA repair exonuclease SbcCD ATPase subunit